MAITLPNVPPSIPNARYDDDIVQRLQNDFATNLSWLERSYHIARIGLNSKDGKGYPQIQANDGTNTVFDIRPDSQVKAYSFFEIEDKYRLNNFEGEATYFLSVTFWGNLNLIQPATTTDFTGNLIQEVKRRLEIKGVGEMEVEENPEEIFEKYSALTQEANQYLMRRYTAFKIIFEITTGLKNSC